MTCCPPRCISSRLVVEAVALDVRHTLPLDLTRDAGLADTTELFEGRILLGPVLRGRVPVRIIIPFLLLGDLGLVRAALLYRLHGGQLPGQVRCCRLQCAEQQCVLRCALDQLHHPVPSIASELLLLGHHAGHADVHRGEPHKVLPGNGAVDTACSTGRQYRLYRFRQAGLYCQVESSAAHNALYCSCTGCSCSSFQVAVQQLHNLWWARGSGQHERGGSRPAHALRDQRRCSSGTTLGHRVVQQAAHHVQA
mmetsp:Transcript_22868/g.50125  ORF Transcript_22868/g.50125 Transcript_22868/m.50125 type:complete len:252 (-) Transcript_22868:3958-4713(-)